MLPSTNESTTQPPEQGTGRLVEITGRSRHQRQRSRGQALVEFAILVPVLLLILAIAADFGRAFTAYIAIGSAAHEGATFGMQSLANANDSAKIRSAALADAPSIMGVAPTVPNAVVSKDAQGYNRVAVTVNYTFSPLMPIPPIPNSISLTRTVTMRVIN